MDSLTTYRGRIRNGKLETDPPIPTGQEFDVVVTVLRSAKGQEPTAEAAVLAINQLFAETAHISHDISQLILDDRDA